MKEKKVKDAFVIKDGRTFLRMAGLITVPAQFEDTPISVPNTFKDRCAVSRGTYLTSGLPVTLSCRRRR